jgi:hypothetical protein
MRGFLDCGIYTFKGILYGADTALGSPNLVEVIH